MRPSPAALAIGVLDGGFVIPAAGAHAGLRVLTDHEIFRRERRIRRARRYVSGGARSNVTALKPGDYVVHLEHGVGIYRGIETIFVGQSTIEVAVSSTRAATGSTCRSTASISSSAIAPPTTSPTTRRRRACTSSAARRGRSSATARASRSQEMTVELLDLYARRKIASRPPHVPDTPWQRQLESASSSRTRPTSARATTR